MHTSIHIDKIKAAGIVVKLCLLLLGVFTPQPSQAQLNTTQAIETGRAAMLYDDYVTSIQYFSRAIEAKPYLAEAYYYRGLAYFHLADYQTAEEDLTRAIVFNPFHVEYYQLRGLCRIHNVRYASAIDDYTAVLRERPEEQDAYFNRALCLYELQEYSQANADLDHIIRHWPRFARAYVVKAQTSLEMHDTIQGLFWIDSLLNISKREPIAWTVKGEYVLEKGEYSLAEDCFTQALRYDAGNIHCYLNRAQARIASGNFNGALNDYNRVLSIDPNNELACHNSEVITNSLSTKNPSVLARLQSVDNTASRRNLLEEFKGKVEHRTHERVFLPPYRVSGQHIYVEGGRYPVYCNDQNFLDMLVSADIEKGISVSSALFRLRQYVETVPDDAVLLYNLGCLEVEAGTLEEAEKAFSAAITLNPLLAEGYYNKAVALLLQNNAAPAVPLLKQAGEMGIVKAFKLLSQIPQKQ